jgi:acyl-lipid omega-6 desaturase (Delta-12 desaturase)
MPTTELPIGAAPRQRQWISSQVSRSDVHERIAPYARPNSALGYLAFVIDTVLYAGGIACVLFAESLGLKIAGGVLASTGLVNLGSLSHEAAHRSLVKSKLGNKILAVASLTMLLFNYRLWIHDHHVMHHGRTNVKQNNFLSPLTLAEFRALSPFRRAIYRAYHSETGLGILLYYLLERWPSVHFYPGSWLPKRLHASAWRYTALETLYAAALLSLLVLVPSARGESVLLAVLLGFVMPYAVWFTMFSMTAFLQHTNPRLRWYGDVSSVASRPEALSVHVQIPAWMNHMTHYVLEHPVHHVSAMIPHYHLKKAQIALAGVVGPPIIAMRFTFGNMRDVLRRCKLYDYENHVWTDFEGRVTAVPDDTVLQRQADSAAGASDRLPPYGVDDAASPRVFFPTSEDAGAEPACEAGARAEHEDARR